LEANPDAQSFDSSDPIVTESPLEIRSLGVQGFVLRHDHETVITAPLFTRQSAFEVTLNVPLMSDPAAVDAGLGDIAFDEVRAVVSGHAHYDHLLDVPRVLEKAAHATAYTNASGQHILAALAPDRPDCTSSTQPVIPRERVVAVDGAESTWLAVPNSHIRIMPIRSMHPAQIGPYHFGAGTIDHDLCELPSAASGWLEGQTYALLIDWLDDSGTPIYRVFYEDAPTNPPIADVPAAVLAEKRVDVALLCVGSSDAVEDYPTHTLTTMNPRFALSGHWEDFFKPTSDAPQPIPLLDVAAYTARAEAALPGRHTLVQPNQRIVVE
jgi:hypothetical protein